MKDQIKYLAANFWYLFTGTKLKKKLQYGEFTVPILNYHSINPNLSMSGFRISPENFEKQIHYLSSTFNIISLNSLINSITAKQFLNNAAVITFDDGYLDNYTYAFPILKKYKCHVTIFIPTAFIEGKKDLFEYEKLVSLSWPEIIEMKDSGLVSFGAHGHSHKSLGRLSLNEITDEIRISKEILESRLREKIDLFAYPNGQWSDFNDEVINILRDSGFIAACSTIWNTENSMKNIFFLNRILIESKDNMERFKLKLNGGYNYMRFIHKARLLCGGSN